MSIYVINILIPLSFIFLQMLFLLFSKIFWIWSINTFFTIEWFCWSIVVHFICESEHIHWGPKYGCWNSLWNNRQHKKYRINTHPVRKNMAPSVFFLKREHCVLPASKPGLILFSGEDVVSAGRFCWWVDWYWCWALWDGGHCSCEPKRLVLWRLVWGIRRVWVQQKPKLTFHLNLKDSCANQWW